MLIASGTCGTGLFGTGNIAPPTQIFPQNRAFFYSTRAMTKLRV
jgi:hypothetical protein